jgi:VWFA-related protein
VNIPTPQGRKADRNNCSFNFILAWRSSAEETTRRGVPTRAIDHPFRAWQHQSPNEEDMKKSVWIRSGVLSVFILALAVPPGTLRALAQQDNGPIKPPGQQQNPPQAPAQPEPQKQGAPKDQQTPGYSISVESNLVNVDAVVTDNDGNILTGLKKENFRVIDDGQAQQITNFAPTDAPITMVILMEFSQLGYGWFAYNARNWSYAFLQNLNKKDWVALITYDLKTHIEVDFTQNKDEVQQSLFSLMFPGFHEANTFDALIETLDRLQDVKGKKSILLLSAGFDTFSKHTLDQTIKRVKNTDVTIFSVGIGEELFVRSIRDGGIAYLQAKNQLGTFTRLTGGYAWFPRFDGELPGIFQTVTAFLRNQYTIGFIPSNPAHDGKYHKLKLEALDNNGNPLTVNDKKGHPKKVIVYAREGYTALTGSVSD